MITLTQEQAKALEIFKDYKYTLKDYMHHSELWQDRLLPLTYFSLDQMAKILYEPNSYKIEKPKLIKVGDWVTRTASVGEEKQWQEGYTFKVFKIEGKSNYEDRSRSHLDESLRPATKEEIFWAELGREVGEFRVNDARLNVAGVLIHVDNTELANRLYTKGTLQGFYPAESFKEFPKKEVTQ